MVFGVFERWVKPPNLYIGLGDLNDICLRVDSRLHWLIFFIWISKITSTKTIEIAKQITNLLCACKVKIKLRVITRIVAQYWNIFDSNKECDIIIILFMLKAPGGARRLRAGRVNMTIVYKIALQLVVNTHAASKTKSLGIHCQ